MDINTDIDAAGYFSFGFVPDGVGKDGMPLYKEVLQVTIARPPELLITRNPEDDDFRRYAEQYEAFQRANAKRQMREGYPLTMWPVVSLAELNMCHARDIVTVQQLASARSLPPQLADLGRRAKQLLEMQGQSGQYEKIIADLKAEVAALSEQLAECNTTIAAQNLLIGQLPAGKAA